MVSQNSSGVHVMIQALIVFIYAWGICGGLGCIGLVIVYWRNSTYPQNPGYIPVLATILVAMGPFSFLFVAGTAKDFRIYQEHLRKKQECDPDS